MAALLGQHRRHKQGDGGEEQQARLKSGAYPIELLLVMAQSTDQESSAEHEQRVAHNGSGNRRLDQEVLSGLQGSQRNDEFGQVAKCGVEQSANRFAGLVSDRFRRSAEQGCERNNGKDRQQEEKSMPVWPYMLAYKHDRNKQHQPE